MFTSEDRQRLQLFCDVCDETAKCRFLRTFLDQPQYILGGKLSDGRVVDEYPRYDDDDFRAFLTHYRKLRLKQDPTHLFSIMNLLKWKGNVADRGLLDQFKSEINEEGRCWWGSMHPGEGYTDTLTQEYLEDLILYGEVIHADPQKREELARVTHNTPLPKAVALLNYMRFARTVVGCAERTASLIRERGYLTHA
jgi:hypothetical protein